MRCDCTRAMFVSHIFGKYYFYSTIAACASFNHLFPGYFLSIRPSLPSDINSEQDKTPSRSSLEVHRLLDEELPSLWKGKKFRIPWPPGSLNLTSIDIFIGIWKRQLVSDCLSKNNSVEYKIHH